MSKKYRIDLVTLGDELLLGLRENSHLAYLGKRLSAFGLTIQRNIVIRDNAQHIMRFFEETWEKSDIVITTGGLGPTLDDITRETISTILERPLVHMPEVEEAIRERFERRNLKVTENNLRQCYVLEGAQVLHNHWGTAPGQWLEHNGKILIMLPGPSAEMRPMFEQAVLPLLQEKGIATPQETFLQLRSAGIGESMVETRLQPIFDKYRFRLTVGYCAHAGVVDVRLGSVGSSLDWDDIKEIGEECRDELDEDFLCFGDKSLAEVITDTLAARQKTVAVAESCTGGLLSSQFTRIPGASKVFAGGLVSYSDDAKVQLLDVPEPIILQHGAVSAECAVAMATGAAEKYVTDYALSVTGFSGPDGGTLENPVGTIFFGFHSPVGAWSKRVLYPGKRHAVNERAVNMALDWMRRKLLKYQVHEVLADMSL